jgi:uncharacterized protein (TIGR02266 family)
VDKDKHRRQDERRRARVKARVSPRTGGDAVSGFTRDLSRGGMFIQTRKPFAPGTPIKVELFYPDNQVELQGVVVRALRIPGHLQGNQASGMGIRFPDSAELAKVAGLQRKARIAVGSDVVVFFGSERHHLELHDLSTSGAALLSATDVPVTGFLRIHFKLSSTGEVIELEGVPVSKRAHDGKTLIGVDFIDPTPESVARIETLIAERKGSQDE